MPSIDEKDILRINCPGFGESSYLSAGCARPLEQYHVIVVNPTSILHLFDKDPELLKQIEQAQTEGLTSYTCKNDKVLQSILPDLEQRGNELAEFLEKGGLLIYFLNPPFLVQAGSTIIDNYYWLSVLAPDKSQDKNRRNLSSAARGKNVELTPEGQASPLSAYLSQTGLEWNTLVRIEKLAEAYSVLATAGPHKCIAGGLDIQNDNGGQVIFLPAPYQQKFDEKLLQGINVWFGSQDRKVAPPPISSPAWDEKSDAFEQAGFKNEHFTPEPAMEPEAAAADAEFKPEFPLAESEQPPVELQVPEPPPEPIMAEVPEVESPVAQAAPPPPPLPEPIAAETAPPPPPIPEPPVAESPAPAAAQLSPGIIPKAKDLMEKMEEISKQAVPDWAQQYTFPDLETLRSDLHSLNEQVRVTQQKISEVESRISSMEWLKNALISLEGEELHKACAKVFERLGWAVMPAEGHPDEAWLQDGQWTVGIARIVRTTSQAKRADLAQLAESIITYWGEHESEPKGILVASTWANRPPSERSEEDYSDALAEFAEKKHLCLMTTTQLLAIYRELECGQVSADELREAILSTSGRLSGYVLEPNLVAGRS